MVRIGEMMSMKKYDELIQFIIDNIGGVGNVSSANHCATRLRLKLKDTTQFNEEKLKENPLILGTVKRENEVQIIIGPDVPKVFSLFSVELEKNNDMSASPDVKSQKNLKAYALMVVDFISGTFVPVLPILVAAGLVSAVLNIGVTFFGLSNESGTYAVLNAVNNAGFYFLPVFIGYSAAKKAGIDGMMGMFLGTILVHSLINGAEGLSFLGLSIPQTSYNTTTIPVIFGVLFMAFIDKLADRVIPQAIKYFFKPLIVILITVPITLLFLGPLGNVFGGYIASSLSFLYAKLGWLSVGLVGAITPLLVMTGTNQALFPLVFAMMADFGYDSFVMPAMLAANVAVGAAALGISLIEKNTDKRSLAVSAGITGVMGITEPAIFGVLINYKSAFAGAVIGGGVGGMLAGLVQLKQYAIVSPGIAAIPTFIPTDGSGLNSNFWFSIAVILLSMSVSLASTILLEKRRMKQEKVEKADQSVKILSPVTGTVVSLDNVNDQMFAEKLLGDGIAVNPTTGTIVSPFDGIVIMTTETKHAIGIRGENGVEVLIHIGIDTVELGGNYFDLLVKENQVVRAGDELVSFDIEKIHAAGYELTTPVVVTNTAEHETFAKTIQDSVQAGEYLFSVN